ncbi:MAG: hypothetical protein WCL39_01740, partial [Armatimonadota bacterium]
MKFLSARYVLIPACIAAALVSLSSSSARSASHIYSQSRKTIRVCNLLLPGMTGNPTSWNAGFLSILDNRIDLKPAGWDLVNPLSPNRVTARIRTLYGTPAVGQRVFKTDPWYWDVELEKVTLSRLLQYDLVYLCIPAGMSVQLDPEQREMLRKLVDGGAQLWVDWNGGGNGGVLSNSPCGGNSLFVPDVDFGSKTREPGYPVSRHHAMLSYPFWLTQNEINRLGTLSINGVVVDPAGGFPSPRYLSTVVANGSEETALPLISAGQYGTGHIIFSAIGVGQDVVRSGFAGNPALAAPEDIKLAYNILAWGANYTTTYQGPSHSSSSGEGPGAPLQLAWQYPVAGSDSPDPGGLADSAAVIYKGVVFYTDQGGVVHAFDAIPKQDLDGDGNPDDGIPDLSQGAPYDELWKLDVQATSGPTVVNWPLQPNIGQQFANQDILLVTTATGVVGITAFPPGLANPTSGPIYAGFQPVQRAAPVWHNSVIYVADTLGNLQCYDVAAQGPMAPRWQIPYFENPSVNFGLRGRDGIGPTLGWVQDAGSKAVDLVAYWMAERVNQGQPSLLANDDLIAAVMAVRNEPMKLLPGKVLQNRYYSQWDYATDPSQWNLWAYNGSTCESLNGDVETLAVPQPGTWRLTDQGASDLTSAMAFVDYRMARVKAEIGNNPTIIGGRNYQPRTTYTPKPVANVGIPAYPQFTATAPVAMAADGNLYVVGTRPTGSGVTSMLYALKEYGPHSNVQPGESSYPSSVMDWGVFLGAVQDQMTGRAFAPGQDVTLDTSATGLGDAILSMTASGPPAVTDDAVYVTAEATTVNGNAIVLMAFDRRHTFQIKFDPSVTLVDPVSLQPYPIKIWQPDPFNTGATTQLPFAEAPRLNRNYIDMARRTITIDNFDPPNASVTINGRPLLSGLPVHIWVGDQEAIVDDTGFRNLRWYYVAYRDDVISARDAAAGSLTPVVMADRAGMGGAGATGSAVSPPTVMGDYVYFGTTDGYIFSVKRDATPSKGKQVFGVATNYYRTCKNANPLASCEGNASREVAWQRQESTPTGGVGGLNRPIAAAGGIMAAVGEGGIMVFDSPGTLIVDNNRLVEVDAGAGAVWSLDSTVEQNMHQAISGIDQPITAMSAKKTTFARPSIARFVDQNNLLICDTGNNRIVQCDRSGMVQVEIKTFQDPKGLLLSGAPKSLNGPVDVRTWQGIEADPAVPGNGPLAYVYHYLVVDRDNFRILDLVVRFDASGKPLA